MSMHDERFEASPPPKRSWIARNWMWAIPLIALLPMLCCGGFIGGIFAMVSGVLKSAEPYQTALEQASTDPAVIARLGEPIEDGTWLPMGNVNLESDGGNADLKLQIRGPQGTATVHTVATSDGGKWDTETLEVTFENGDRLDLLK